MSDRRDTEAKLGRFTIPDPGELVRARALAAGREAFAKQVAPDIWERIWSSPIFRLAWTAVVLLLLAGHLVLRGGPGAAVATPRYVERMLGSDADEELVAGLVLPSLDRTVQSRWTGLSD
jgi:hypothetical protein